jgi:hypothetical protein
MVCKSVDRIVCKLGLPYLVCYSYRGVIFRVFLSFRYLSKGWCVTGSVVEFFSVSKNFYLYIKKIMQSMAWCIRGIFIIVVLTYGNILTCFLMTGGFHHIHTTAETLKFKT